MDALARGLTAEEAAKVSGYSERTIRRRRRALRAEIAAQVRENLDQGVRELQAGIGEAARALRGMANGTVEGTPVRASAARAVIELGLRGAEMLEVLPRLAELEQLVLEARGHRRVS